jgi:RNA polymerase sigma-70 factor (ECF subfamily)
LSLTIIVRLSLPRGLILRNPRGIAPSAKKKTQAQEEKSLSAEEILLKYWPQISYRVKNSIGRSTPDWEDIASEIFVAVIEAIRKGTFRGESAWPTFIYSITTHKIVDYIRHKKRALEPIPETGPCFDPSIQAENQEQVRLVAGLLKKLKPRYADILYLHYYQDLSRDEIARIYGISPGRVGVLIAAARKTMKELMKKLGVLVPGGTGSI